MKQVKWIIGGLVMAEVIGIAFLIKNRLVPEEAVTVLEREAPGTGNFSLELEAATSMGRLPVRVEVEERIYSEEELEAVFEQGKAWLDGVWLGENSDPGQVATDLYFPNRIEDLGLTVRWIPEDTRWIQADGQIREAVWEAAPVTTRVRAVLSYGEAERGYDYEFSIQQPAMDGAEAMKESLGLALRDAQAAHPDWELFELPDQVGTEPVTWYMPRANGDIKGFLFGNVLAGLLWLCYRDRSRQQEKRRQWYLSQDYPDIVYRMILLVSSGMTVRGAWEKMVLDYRRWNGQTGKRRFGYEEMERALHEMGLGVSEVTAYENFGNRCGSRGYVRFASLLVQQVRRGGRGMNDLLAQEVSEAELIRRENGRRAAEEAAGRLLFPMMLLMTVVFAVLMIPAFLTMGF